MIVTYCDVCGNSFKTNPYRLMMLTNTGKKVETIYNLMDICPFCAGRIREQIEALKQGTLSENKKEGKK